MVHAMRAALVTLVCAALILQPAAAAAYNFNFGGGKALAVCNRFAATSVIMMTLRSALRCATSP